MHNPKEHWEKKAQELKNERKFEEAVEILDKVKEVKKSERSEDFWYKKAVHFCEIGEYEQAKESLYKDIEINKINYKSLFLLGKILFELKSYEESLEYLNKASEYHSSKILKNTHKIEQMKNVNKFEEAVLYADKVNQQKNIDDSFWFLKGKTYFKLNKITDAISCYNSALEMNQSNTKILYELAKAELFSGNKEKTFEILSKVCKIDPINKEKLRLDKDFEKISDEKKFRIITDSLNS